MGRQMTRRPSMMCGCPRCVAATGFDVMRGQMDTVAITVGTMMDILEHHFSSRQLARMQVSGLMILEGLELAYAASKNLERKVDSATNGECLTLGVKTMPDTSGALARSN